MVLSQREFNSFAYLGKIGFVSLKNKMPKDNTYYNSLVAHELGHALYYLYDEYLDDNIDKADIPNNLNCFANKAKAKTYWESIGLKEGQTFDYFEGCYYKRVYYRGVECSVMGSYDYDCSWDTDIGEVNRAIIENNKQVIS